MYVGDDLVAKMSVAEFQDLKKLRKFGGQLFQNLDPANRTEPLHDCQTGSHRVPNVNPIEEMTNMINANRLFEQDMKSLKTYGDLMGKEVNEVGKL